MRPFRSAALFALLFCSALAGAVESASFQSCRATWDGSRLTLANSHVERQWVWQKGHLHPVSFRDLDRGFEWIVPVPAAAPEQSGLKFSSRPGAATPVQAASLTVDLEASPSIAYHFQIFPEARGILVQGAPDSLAEALTLAPEHIRLIQVTLLDQTDVHNQLVFESEWLPQRNEKPLQLEGDLFIAEDTLSHSGLVFVKLAPLPHARPIKEPWDLEAVTRGRNLQCTLSSGSDYPYVVLSYAGGRTGRTEALQGFQRQIRPYVASRDGMFLSNTWGDRSRDARINSEFMGHEIEAGSSLGVDVIQIDDGWQTGRTINSARGPGVWNGYWAENPNFWQPDPIRFPGGLKPLVQEAAKKGMKFGLWYSPDSSNSFVNWQRDAGRLLELHHNDGIDYFKIDGVKAITKEGEQNLRRMFNQVQRETNGAVVFDLDVTAETRPGYFGMSDVGPLFVENRYTDFHGYWPHQTLRNLWQLAAYVDPLRLRVEVLNNERNQKLYAGDPLAPEKYSPDMLFATVMFANPLGWFETSNLSPSYMAAMTKLVTTWKKERTELFSDTILPIGEAPDGTNWSGFAAFNHARTSGYLLLFRGVGSPADWRTRLDVFGAGKHRAQVLGGEGAVSLEGGGISASIPQAPGFVWVRVN